jgi:hypothetical protein
MTEVGQDDGVSLSRTEALLVAHGVGVAVLRRLWPSDGDLGVAWSRATGPRSGPSDDVCRAAFEEDAGTPGPLADALNVLPYGPAYGAYSAGFFGIDLDDWLWGPVDLDATAALTEAERELISNSQGDST